MAVSRKRSDRKARANIVLACSVCGGRNYKTTKALTATEPLRLRKFCKTCDAHTEHLESK